MNEITRPIGAAILLQRRIHDGGELVTGLGAAVKFSVRRQSDGRYWDGSAFTDTTYVELDATEPYAAGGAAANNHNKGLYTYSLAAGAAAAADVLEWASVYSDGAFEYAETGEVRIVATTVALSAAGLDLIVPEPDAPTLNLRQLLALWAAVLTGKASGLPTAPVFKSADGATTRVNATTDAAGNRTAVTLTPPA